MNQQINNIAETLEQASKSRITFDEAEQQIRRISAGAEVATIKTNALQILTKAKSDWPTVTFYQSITSIRRVKM